MKYCSYCSEELTFVIEFECSIYYRCLKCRTLWDYMVDDASNEEIMVDIGYMLEEIKRKKIAI